MYFHDVGKSEQVQWPESYEHFRCTHVPHPKPPRPPPSRPASQGPQAGRPAEAGIYFSQFWELRVQAPKAKLARASFLGHLGRLLTVSSRVEGAGSPCGVSSTKDASAVPEGSTLLREHPHKAPPPHTTTVGGQGSHMNWRGEGHTPAYQCRDPPAD